VSGRITDKDKGVWKVNRRGKWCTCMYRRLTVDDKGVLKVNRREQGCLEG
jgi:hypothetical protein